MRRCCAASSRLSSGLQLVDLRLRIAAQHDVGAAARHVGRDGDGLGPARLHHDFGFARVLLGVQHVVRQLFLVEHFRQQLGILDRGGADQHRLAALVAILDVLDHRLVFLAHGLIDLVHAVVADHRLVGRDHHRFEPVDMLEFVGLGIGGAGHARELRVHAEIILERDRRERLVLALDRHAFLGLDRLMQAVRPAPPGHQAAGELVDDDDLAVLHHVLLVAVKQRMRAQRRIQVVHQVDVARVVEAAAVRQQARPRRAALRRARGRLRTAAPGALSRRRCSRPGCFRPSGASAAAQSRSCGNTARWCLPPGPR